MADWTSLANDLNSATLMAFGREVVYQLPAGGMTIRAIFEPTQQGEENAPGVYAVLFIRLSDLPQRPARGDAVMVDASFYQVFDIQADTSGAAVLRLRQV